MWTHVFLVSLGLCIFTDLTRPCDSPFFFPPSLSRFTLFHLLFLFLLSLSLVAFSLIQIKKTRKCRLDRKEFRFLGHFHENVEKLVWRQIVCWFFHFFFHWKNLRPLPRWSLRAVISTLYTRWTDKRGECVCLILVGQVRYHQNCLMRKQNKCRQFRIDVLSKFVTTVVRRLFLMNSLIKFLSCWMC